MNGYIILAGLAWLVLAVIAGSVASVKGISGLGAFLLTILIGPVGLAIILLLPSRVYPET